MAGSIALSEARLDVAEVANHARRAVRAGTGAA